MWGHIHVISSLKFSPSPIQSCDIIIFVGENGTIDEMGTWDELCNKKDGKFAAFVKIQSLDTSGSSSSTGRDGDGGEGGGGDAAGSGGSGENGGEGEVPARRSSRLWARVKDSLRTGSLIAHTTRGYRDPFLDAATEATNKLRDLMEVKCVVY